MSTATAAMMIGPGHRRLHHACRVAGLLVVFMLAVGLLSGCAGSKKKRLTPPSLLALRINGTISELETRLNQRDERRLYTLLTDALANDETFSRDLDQLMSAVSELRVQFLVERIWLIKEEIRVDLHWTMRATLRSGPMTTAGTARFTMEGKEKPRLSAVSGDNPFSLQLDAPLIR